MKCIHCDSIISGTYECTTCEERLCNQCSICHDEIIHKQIKNQNIHFVGNRNQIEDEDAFKKAETNE